MLAKYQLHANKPVDSKGRRKGASSSSLGATQIWYLEDVNTLKSRHDACGISSAILVEAELTNVRTTDMAASMQYRRKELSDVGLVSLSVEAIIVSSSWYTHSSSTYMEGQTL